jgi:hypothetical protein
MKTDGSGRRKVIPDRIIDVEAVSPDGRWVVIGEPSSDEEHTTITKAVAVDGGASSLPLCIDYCTFDWDASGKYVYLSVLPGAQSGYALPVLHDLGLPKLPPAGLTRSQDFTNPKTNIAFPWAVQSAVNPSVYAYTRETTRRNLYRIQMP